MATLDWAIVIAYLAAVLAVGVVFARRAGGSTDEFFISGRNLPWWIAGTSMVATSFAADTPLVITAWVRESGISFNWLWWSFAIGGMFSVFLLSRLWRRAEVVTDVELTEMRYGGRPAAALRGFRAAYMAIPVNCITLAWVIIAMKKLLETLLGFHPVASIAVCLALTLVYAVVSGFWGVVITDLFQFVLAMGGSLVLAVIAVRHIGGFTALRESATAASPLGERLVQFFPRPPEGTTPLDGAFWTGPIFAFSVFLFVQWWANKNADGGGVVIQRMAAARDERESLLATLWFNIANYALRPWPWIIVALASVVLLPDVEGETAYPEMIKALAPVGLMGVMVASFLGAFMSTVDTHLNLSAAYLVNDLYRRFIVTGAGERHYVLVSRLASVAVLLVAGGIALAADSISGLFQFLLAFTSGIGLVLILRWFWWRLNAWSEISAMAASGVVAIALYLARSAAPERLAWLSNQWILLVTVVVSTAIWVPVTFLTRPVPQEKLVEFYRKVRPWGAWGPVPREAGVAPAAGLWKHLGQWIAGTVMVLAATLSIGAFVLGDPRGGFIYLVVAVSGAAGIWGALKGDVANTSGVS